MKIISKYKDFYDFLVEKYGQDEKNIFEWDKNIIPEKLFFPDFESQNEPLFYQSEKNFLKKRHNEKISKIIFWCIRFCLWVKNWCIFSLENIKYIPILISWARKRSANIIKNLFSMTVKIFLFFHFLKIPICILVFRGGKLWKLKISILREMAKIL